MDILLSVVSGLLIFIGIIGCFVPVLPGPPISYVALLLLQLKNVPEFSSRFLLFWLLITIAVTALDYIVPVIGTKKFGGTKKGVRGSILGLIIGLLFFPPLGIIIGPIVGAFIGEIWAGQESKQAIRAAIGSFIGFLLGTGIKLMASGFMTFYFIQSIF